MFAKPKPKDQPIYMMSDSDTGCGGVEWLCQKEDGGFKWSSNIAAAYQFTDSLKSLLNCIVSDCDDVSIVTEHNYIKEVKKIFDRNRKELSEMQNKVIVLENIIARYEENEEPAYKKEG